MKLLAAYQFMTMTTTILYSFLKSFAKASQTLAFSGYVDELFYIESSHINSLVLREAPRLIKTSPETEVHYLCDSGTGCLLVTVLTFGDKPLTKKTKKVTENFYFPLVLETCLFVTECIKKVEISLNTFDNGCNIIVIKRFVNNFKFSPNTNNTMYYTCNARNAVQMFKSSSFVEVEKNFWSSCVCVVRPQKPYFPSLLEMDTRDRGGMELQMFSGLRPFSTLKRAQEELSDSLDKIPSRMRDELSKCLSGLSSNLKTSGGFAMGVLATCYAIDYVVNGTLPSKPLAITVGGIAAAVYGPELMVYLTEILSTKVVTEIQFGETPEFFRKCFSYIFDLLPDVSFKKLKDYVYIITNFDRLKEGCLAILNWIFEQIDNICEYVCKRRIVPVTWYKSTLSNESILSFVDRITSFRTDLKSGKLPVTSFTHAMTLDLITECVEMKSEISRNSGKGSVLDTCYRELVEVKNFFGSIGDAIAGYRATPVSVVIRGGAGNNKTVLNQFIAEALHKKYPMNKVDVNEYLPDSSMKRTKLSMNTGDVSSRMFFRQINCEFWDGYHRQLVVVVDDMGQLKDLAGTPNSQFMEWINMMNSCPYPLPMSKVEDKADTYFNSKFVIATTNQMEFTVESCNERKAVDRRADFDLLVCPARHYCVDPNADIKSKAFDKDLLPKDQLGVIKYTPEMFELYRRRKDKYGAMIINRISFDELMREMFIQHDFYEACHKANLESSKDFFVEAQDVFGLSFDHQDQSPEIATYGSLYDLPEGQPEVTKFMKMIESETGSLKENYKDFFTRISKKFGMSFFGDVMRGNNLKYWVPKAKDEIQMMESFNFDSEDDFTMALQPDKNLVSKLKEFMKDNKFYLSMATFVVTAFSMYRMYSENDDDPQSSTQVRPSKGKEIKTLHNIKSSLSYTQMGGADPAGEQLIQSILNRNCAGIFDDGKQRGMITFVASNVALMNAHFPITYSNWVQDPTADFSLESVITIKLNKEMNPSFTHFTLTTRELLEGILEDEYLEQHDLVLVRFPDRFPKFRNILKHFKSQNKPIYNSVRMDICFHRDKMIQYHTQVGTAVKHFDHAVRWFGSIKEIPECYHTAMETVQGFCGAILSEVNSKAQAKIIGLHEAGASNLKRAVSVPVYKEQLERVLALAHEKDPLIYDNFEETCDLQMRTDVVLENRFERYGKIRPVITSSKTTWEKSELCGLFQEPTLFPSLLHPIKRKGEIIDVRLNSLKPYNKNSGVLINPVFFRKSD